MHVHSFFGRRDKSINFSSLRNLKHRPLYAKNAHEVKYLHIHSNILFYKNAEINSKISFLRLLQAARLSQVVKKITRGTRV